jgi:hypothetical protein
MKKDCPFKSLLKEQDIVVKAGGKQVESVGQFRRLLSYAIQTGQLDIEVERAEKNLHLQSKLTNEYRHRKSQKIQ